MQISYCCTYWGSEKDSPDVFVDKVLSSGYDGIEIFLPSLTDALSELFIEKMKGIMHINADFIFIAQHIVSPEKDTVDNYLSKVKKNLNELSLFKPSFINAHIGKDYFSFDDNCRVIDAALNLSYNKGVRVLFETHRGRFSFHAASLIPYLKKFPEIELVGDFSHFCAVSESMMQDQDEIIQQIIPHIGHIHARIGHEQGAQVNDPFAPEWQDHFAQFQTWWQSIINYQKSKNTKIFTITPEFGPAPYMPSMPFTKQPLGNQLEINLKMMNYLKNKF